MLIIWLCVAEKLPAADLSARGQIPLPLSVSGHLVHIRIHPRPLPACRDRAPLNIREVPRSADYEYEYVWLSRILTRWLLFWFRDGQTDKIKRILILIQRRQVDNVYLYLYGAMWKTKNCVVECKACENVCENLSHFQRTFLCVLYDPLAYALANALADALADALTDALDRCIDRCIGLPSPVNPWVFPKLKHSLWGLSQGISDPHKLLTSTHEFRDEESDFKRKLAHFLHEEFSFSRGPHEFAHEGFERKPHLSLVYIDVWRNLSIAYILLFSLNIWNAFNMFLSLLCACHVACYCSEQLLSFFVVLPLCIDNEVDVLAIVKWT